MGSRFSQFWSRDTNERQMSGDGSFNLFNYSSDEDIESSNNSSSRQQVLDESSSSSSSNSDEDPALAIILAYMLRNGHMRQFRSRLLCNDWDDCDGLESRNQSHAEAMVYPNTVKENDICQKVLLNQAILVSKENKCKDSTNVINKLKQREMRLCGLSGKNNFTRGTCTLLSARCIPNTDDQKIQMEEKLFCGTYSADGKKFLSACQDRHIRVYDTEEKFDKPFKDVIARDIGWSILDTDFREDARYFAYSTWSNLVHMCSVFDNNDPNLMQHSSLNLEPDQYNFAVFSLQFATDGHEILCGANDGCLYIYNTEQDVRTLKVDAHEDDVNAVCFADSRSQILFSGGDDGLVKVWDRRILSESSALPVGVLAGHQDGITYIDTLGDSRYLLSNSKDQSIKLWDLRCFSSNDAVDKVRQTVSQQSWDYRWENIPQNMRQNNRSAIDGDTSIRTYIGHRVLNTLIRAKFSPIHSTGNKYIYSGCSTGRVFVYDLLTGDIVSSIKGHKDCVRDISWHPFKQELISSSWDGTFKLWKWKHQ